MGFLGREVLLFLVFVGVGVAFKGFVLLDCSGCSIGFWGGFLGDIFSSSPYEKAFWLIISVVCFFTNPMSPRCFQLVGTWL